RRCRSSSTCSSTKASAWAARPASTWPAPSASPRTWAPATPSSRSSPITARVISRSCSIRNFCGKKGCRCPGGWSGRQARRCPMSDANTQASPTSRWLVSTDWLGARLGAPDLVVVDGSFYLPAMKRDAAAEYLADHIPSAVRFDIDAIADHANPLPHMLPSAEQFARDVGALGIADTD